MLTLCCLGGVRAQTPQQTKPPTKPPGQRPPGTPPASQQPPHPPPGTSPKLAQSLPTYEGQTVVSVELAGWPALEAAPLLSKLPQQAQKPFSRARVDQSIGAIKAALAAQPSPQGGRLQNVQLEVVPEPEGIRVLFILEPAEYFGVYEFPGALRFNYARLLEAADYEPQRPYTAYSVERGRRGLTQFLRQEGYFQAQVTPVLHPDARHGLVSVTFGVKMGPRARFGAVRLEGATPEQTAYLQAALTTWMARLRRAAILPGHAYNLATLRNAAQRLQSTLNSRHYLGAQVVLTGAAYDAASNRADITFRVSPGPRIRLRVEGMHLWPWNRGLLPILAESRVDPELIQEGGENLVNYLSSRGYFDAQVTTTVRTSTGAGSTTTESANATTVPAAPMPAPAGAPAETIEYRVVKGPARDVERIRFQGNRHFTEAQLLPQVTIQPEGFFWFAHGDFSAPLLRSSLANLKTFYEAAGFSSVQVQARVAHPNGNLAVTFVVVEGPQDVVDSLQIEGNTLAVAQIAPKGLKLGPGTAYSLTLVAQDRAQILAQYLSRGYLNATLRTTAQRETGHPHRIRVVYRINQGPQVRIAAIVTAGRQVTQQRLINRHTAELEPEKYLTENDMLTAESQLYEPGIFDWAEVRPRRPITTQTQEDVVIKVHESLRNSLIYGFGFDLTNRGGSIPSGTVAVPGLPVVGLPSSFKTSQATFYGPSGNIEYSRLNIGGKAETLSVGGYAGRLDQHGSLTFTDPSLFWTRFRGNLLVSAEHDSQNPIFTSRIGQVGYQLERALNPDRTTNLFLRYTFSQTNLSRLLIPDLVPTQDRNVRLSTLAASFLRDTRDNPLDAHKGVLESYELDYSPSALGSSADFAKVVTQTAYYRKIAGGTVWANSLRVGFAHAFGSSFVPLSQTFFTGGGSTLRGFPLDGAGPQRKIPACGNPSDPSTCSVIQVPVGGRALFIVNTELRIPTPFVMQNLGVALFYDGGNVFSHFGLRHLGANYSNSIGFGLRYATPVGPIRIDIGHNLNGLPGIAATQIFITLGQAF